MSSSRLLLLDTASLYFRAFYGVPDSIKAADGRPVNAVRGILDFLATLQDRYEPEAVVAAWDDDLRVAILKALRAAGIEIPFNRLDVTLRDLEAMRRYLDEVLDRPANGSGSGRTEAAAAGARHATVKES